MTKRSVGLAAIWASGACMTLLACNSLAGLDRDFALVSRDDEDAATEKTTESDVHAEPADGAAPPLPSSSDGGALDAEPPPEKIIHCGSTSKTCSAGAQTCCPVLSGGYDCKTESACRCVDVGTCTAALRIDCDDETDCPSGQVCCGTLTNDKSALTQAVCVSSASCSGSRNVHLCDTTAERPGCANGGPCVSFSGYPGIGRCSM